jgi:8-oxo-dGTP pyrophosphatase MutT (NUDIX family)
VAAPACAYDGRVDDATRLAAVLAPVFRDDDGELRILLVVRSDHGVHGGQLAFPGGRRDPGDADLVATALRETEEEIGLARADVEVLAALPPQTTGPSRFLAHPFLARIPANPRLTLHPTEIAGVLMPSVLELAAPGVRETLPFTFPGRGETRLVDGIDIEGRVLWGFTLRVLDDLLPRLLEGEWEV